MKSPSIGQLMPRSEQMSKSTVLMTVPRALTVRVAVPLLTASLLLPAKLTLRVPPALTGSGETLTEVKPRSVAEEHSVCVAFV